jgi:hypothetical protein
MNMTGVHGIWRAIKDAEALRSRALRAEAFRDHQADYLSRRAKDTSRPAITGRVAYLASDQSIAEECLLSGVITMKRIHCLQRQIGSVSKPAKRYVVTEEGASLGPHYRYKPCRGCQHWLEEDEYAAARQLLTACRGQWDEVVRVVAGIDARTEAA